MSPLLRLIASRRSQVITLLLLLTAFGLFLRLHNLSPYKFYPDSYQSLLVAHNLREYGSPVGRLGPEGMWYPDIFSWTRPAYPLAINLVGLAGFTPESAASIAATAFGVAAVVVAYFFGKRFSQRRLGGLAAALLLAVASSHITWGGFILTETAGVFILLVLLERLLATYHRPSGRYNASELLCGLLFALAVLTRYEYLVLLAPILLLYARQPLEPRSKMVYFLAGAMSGLTAAAGILAPWPYSAASLWSQLRPFVALVLIGLLAAAVLSAARQLRLTDYVTSRLEPVLKNWRARLAVGAAFLALLAGIAAYASLDASGIISFAAADFLISGLALIGIVVMWREAPLRPLAGFVTLACLLLGGAYYQVNPAMQRYHTHLLPFLLIPAVIAAEKLSSKAFRLKNAAVWPKSAVLLLAAAFLFQLAASYKGLHGFAGNIWFQPGYEERVALRVKELAGSGEVLLVSFPEPYFFFTGNSTHSLADVHPFIYLDQSLDARPLLIVQDIGMRDQFPRFDAFLTAEMHEYQVAEFLIDTPYRYQARIEPEDRPVRVYKTTPGTLKYKLSQ